MEQESATNRDPVHPRTSLAVSPARLQETLPHVQTRCGWHLAYTQRGAASRLGIRVEQFHPLRPSLLRGSHDSRHLLSGAKRGTEEVTFCAEPLSVVCVLFFLRLFHVPRSTALSLSVD